MYHSRSSSALGNIRSEILYDQAKQKQISQMHMQVQNYENQYAKEMQECSFKPNIERMKQERSKQGQERKDVQEIFIQDRAKKLPKTKSASSVSQSNSKRCIRSFTQFYQDMMKPADKQIRRRQEFERD